MDGRMGACAQRLSQHYNLSTRFVLLHAAMRLNDFVEVERFANLDVQCARRNLLN